VPVFFYNPQQPSRTFFVIAGSCPALFFESSVTAANFFRNPQLGARTFFRKLSIAFDLFWKLSARDRNFSKKHVTGRLIREKRCPTRENASSGFLATHLPGSYLPIKILAQRGPDEAPERLRAAARRGRNRYYRMPFPKLNDEPDPDVLAHEGSVTKQFWKTLYRRIDYRRNASI